MKVLKFGGSCLRNAYDMDAVARIITRGGKNQVVVLSALYGVTDELCKSIEHARKGESRVPDIIYTIRKMHFSIANRIIKDEILLKETKYSIDKKLEKLERLLYGISYTEEITDRTLALILSFGERLAVRLACGCFRSRGIDSVALDSDEIGITTDDSFENATAIISDTKIALEKNVLPLIRKGKTPLITGYFGRTRDGKTTTFGMNGSDYSTALIGSCLKTDSIEIWKDVDGFMTADPALVKGAKHLENISYYEAAELSYFGAKILHPRTIEPLLGTGIPIYIRNLHKPESKGTKILTNGSKVKIVIKSVTYNRDLSVLKIQGAGVGYKPGIIGDLGKALSSRGINIFSVITSQTCINILIDKRDSERSISAIRGMAGGVIEKIGSVENLALVAVVGEGLLRTKGLAAKVFTAVAKANINVEMISAGASETAYYFIVDSKDLPKAVKAVHEEFFPKK